MKQAHDMVRTAARAAAGLQPEGADEIALFLRGQQNPDGGFRGRSGASDLYYTVFGLSALAALGRAVPEDEVRRYLALVGEPDCLDFVHLASAIRCRCAMSGEGDIARARQLLPRLEEYRSGDGGYHHLQRQAACGTVYGGFLAHLTYSETGGAMPRAGDLLQGLQSLRTPDGGYANVAEVKAATTPATAAAILLQHWIGSGCDEAAIAAILACEDRRGGVLAFPGAPGPDLLSTATAFFALRIVGGRPRNVGASLAFVEGLWSEDGGFRGHGADPVADCEYTFYALLALGACMAWEESP